MTREYAAAGVDLEGAEAQKVRIGRAVAGTRTALSVGKVGAFGGMVRVPAGMRAPTLVLSTDGVGTKVLVALQAQRYDTVGEDLVNHSVNDILVHGATPIAFMAAPAARDCSRPFSVRGRSASGEPSAASPCRNNQIIEMRHHRG